MFALLPPLVLALVEAGIELPPRHLEESPVGFELKMQERRIAPRSYSVGLYAGQ
jgi:hypothetical protein